MSIPSITLQSSKLILKVFRPADLHKVFSGLSNENVVKYYGVSYSSLEAAKEQLSWFENLQSKGEGIWWAIYSANDNTFCGAIGFNNLSFEHKKVEIGFWLYPNFGEKE